MIVNAKAFLVVLIIAWAFFAAARPFCVSIISTEDYARRRNVWLAVTAAEFLLPNFWLYAIFALFLICWAAKRDKNPIALFALLLYVTPPLEFYIPKLIALNNLRIVVIAILIPFFFRKKAVDEYSKADKLTLIDASVIAFGIWQILLFIPYEEFTNTLRRSVVYFLDTFVIYFCIARSGKSRVDVIDVCLMFVLSCCIMSLLAVFESVRGWVLYQYIGEVWGNFDPRAYLFRDGRLRAQVSVGHSLALGYVLALGFGISLYFRNIGQSFHTRWLLPLILWAGLIGAYSRAPWLTAILTLVLSVAIQPGNIKNLVKLLSIGTICFSSVLLSPFGAKIIETLPFIGTVDQFNVEYRQRLADLSWRLILENPWMGDPFFLNSMEELRQGDGIIDLVNGFAAVALFSGLIGLFFYVSTFILVGWRTFRSAIKFQRIGDDFSYLGYCLTACMLGALFFIGTAGTGFIYYVLAGIMASYVRIEKLEENRNKLKSNDLRTSSKAGFARA